ncbi:BA3454 family stress response protein [Bacillus sp. CGMCC 1.16607]
MLQYTVDVVYQGKKYQTNVIVDRETSEEEILRVAIEQVRKQWIN